MAIYISEMSRQVIVIMKTSGKTWSEIQLKLQIQQRYLNLAKISEKRKLRIWLSLVDPENYHKDIKK